MSEKIGIVYSKGFGGGWSSWGEPEQALDQELAKAVEANLKVEALMKIAAKNWPDAYLGGIEDRISVEWVDAGTVFRVSEYDGFESLEFKDTDDGWHVARGEKS